MFTYLKTKGSAEILVYALKILLANSLCHLHKLLQRGRKVCYQLSFSKGVLIQVSLSDLQKDRVHQLVEESTLKQVVRKIYKLDDYECDFCV